jgi:phosphatidylserine decarboxylase
MAEKKTPEVPAEQDRTTVSPTPANPLAEAVAVETPVVETPVAETPVAEVPIAAHAAGGQPAAWQWPSVHPEGWRFAGMSGAIAVVAFLAGWSIVGWLLLALTIFICAFFRDPIRASPAGEGLILSPADGLVSQIVTVALPRQLIGDGALSAGTATRISIFMSVFDVHINRAPIAGTVTRMAYVPGAFLNADLDKASEENERQYFLIEGIDGTKVGFTQIAGLVARRIIGFVREGSMVGIGQRVGLIRFGSRVDVFLPEGYAPQVVKGQRAVAAETVLAVRGASPVRQGAVQ